MGTFLSTQLQWERADRTWELAVDSGNEEALYLLYVELAEVYLRWFRAQDLDFAANNDAQTEDAILLSTTFRRPLVFSSSVPLPALLGESLSQQRLNFIGVQQRRRMILEQELLELEQERRAGSHSVAVHRRRTPPRDGKQAEQDRENVDVDPAVLRLPDLFWKEYVVPESDAALLSRERVSSRQRDTMRSGRLRSSRNPRGDEPAYALVEEEPGEFQCVVWSMKYLLQHLALLAAVVDPELVDDAGDPSGQSAASVSTPHALEAVRRGSFRSYLLLDCDYALCPSRPARHLHAALVAELRAIVEAFANEVGAEDTGGGAEACIASGWREIIIGPPPEADAAATGWTGVAQTAEQVLVRQGVAERVNTHGRGIDGACIVDPSRGAATVPVCILNELLGDADSIRRHDYSGFPTFQKTDQRSDVDPRDHAPSRVERLSQWDDASADRESRGDMSSRKPTQVVHGDEYSDTPDLSVAGDPVLSILWSPGSQTDRTFDRTPPQQFPKPRVQSRQHSRLASGIGRLSPQSTRVPSMAVESAVSPTTAQGRMSPSTSVRQPPTPEAGGHRVSRSPGPHRALDMMAMSIRSPSSKAQRSVRQRHAKVDLGNDLHELTPAEICAELCVRSQREELDDDDGSAAAVNGRRNRLMDRRRMEDRAKQAEKEATHRRHQITADEKESVILEEVRRQDEVDTALREEESAQQRRRTERRQQREREWEKECDSGASDDGFAKVPRQPAHRPRPPPVAPRMPVMGTAHAQLLAFRVQSAMPKSSGTSIPDYRHGRIAVDRPGAVHRLAYAMIWQQLEVVVLAAVASRLRQVQSSAALTPAAAASELAAAAACCGRDPDVFPARTIRWLAGDRPVVPPWRAAAGDIGDAEIALHDSAGDGDDPTEHVAGAALRVVARACGWCTTSSSNNQEGRLLGRMRVDRLDQEGVVGLPYPTLVALLRDHSPHWRSYDAGALEAAAAAAAAAAASTSAPAVPRSPDLVRVATTPDARPGAARRTRRRSSAVGSMRASVSPVGTRKHRVSVQPLSAERLGLGLGSSGDVSTPQMEDRAPSPRRQVTMSPDTETVIRLPSPSARRESAGRFRREHLSAAAASERRRREHINSLRKQQRAIACDSDAAETAPADGSDVSTSSSQSSDPHNLPPDGLNILADGPPRAPQQRRVERKRPQRRRPGGLAEGIPVGLAAPVREPVVISNPTNGGARAASAPTEWEEGDETDDSDDRTNIVSVLRRPALSVRDWGSLREVDDLTHFSASDMLALGDPSLDFAEQPQDAEGSWRPSKVDREETTDDGFSFLARPTQPSVRDLSQMSAAVQYQWIAFIRGNASIAQMLFALRSLIDADLSLPANQFVVLRFNGHAALAQIVVGHRDIRLRLDAAKALLTLAQNPAAAKELSNPKSGVIAAAVRSLHDYCDPSHPVHSYKTGSASAHRMPQQSVKSGQLSRMAVEALGGRKAQRGRGAMSARCSHETFQAVVAFLLTSCALCCGRARAQLRGLSADGAAVTLLARFDGCGGEQLPVALSHLLRALVTVRPYERNRLQATDPSGRGSAPPVIYIPGLVPAIARQLTGPSTPVYVDGEAYARLRTHQALCGLVCMFRRSVRYGDDAAAHHIAVPLAAAQRDVAALVRQARASVVTRVHVALRLGYDAAGVSRVQQKDVVEIDPDAPPEVAEHIEKRFEQTPEQLIEITRTYPPLFTTETPSGLLGCCRVLILTWHALEALVWHPQTAQQLTAVVPEAMELLAALTRSLHVPVGGSRKRSTMTGQARGVNATAAAAAEEGTPGINAFPRIVPAPGDAFVPAADGDSDTELPAAGPPPVDPDRFQLSLLLLTHVLGFLSEACRHPSQPARALVGVSHGAVATLARLLLVDHVVLGRGVAPKAHWGQPALQGGASVRMDRLLATIKEQAAATLSRVAAHRQSQGILVDLALPSVLHELRRGGLGRTGAYLCHVAAALAARSMEVRAQLSKHGQLLTLWSLLSASNWDAREAAAEVISVLILPPSLADKKRSAGGDAQEPEGDSVSERILTTFGDELTILPRLVDPASTAAPQVSGPQRGGSYSGVQCAVCQLIATVCRCAAPSLLALIFADSSLVPRLVDLVDPRATDDDVDASHRLRGAAAHCLWLAAKQQGAEELLKAGAVPKAAARLGKSKDDAAVDADRHVCLLLRQLCRTRPDACAAAVDAGTVPALVKLLGSANAALQDAAASTLAAVRQNGVQGRQPSKDKNTQSPAAARLRRK